MNCPFCQHTQTRVIDSRVAGDGIRRRRECPSCSERFSTVERVEQRMPVVVKKDGRREPFDIGKLKVGLDIALRKRRISVEWIQSAVVRIEKRVFAEAERGEISTRQIGGFVLDELRVKDRVAFLRFASVYQEFDTPEEFIELISGLLTRSPQDDA